MGKLNISNLQEHGIANRRDETTNAKCYYRNAKHEESLLLNKENIDLAKNVYDVSTLHNTKKGVISYTDWMTAEYAYIEAEQNYLTSLVKISAI